MVDHESFLGTSDMGRQVARFDWSQTDLGPIHSWPASLETSVSTMLNARYPMFILWGPQYTLIHNDEYARILGLARSHSMLGQPFHKVWPEIWSEIEPLIKRTYEGETFLFNDRCMFLLRSDYLEETYFSFSYSPIYAKEGSVGGMLCVCTETTEKVIGDRRFATLSRLAQRSFVAKSAIEAFERASQTLAENPNDVPYSLFYAIDWERQQADLKAHSNVDIERLPYRVVDLSGQDNGPFATAMAEVLAAGDCHMIATPEWDWLPYGQWKQQPEKAKVMPIGGSKDKPVGFLITGINSRRAWDQNHLGFFELLYTQVSQAVSNAIAHEQVVLDKAIIEDNERRFRSLVDNSPAMLWVTDTRGLCTYLSKQWYETTGGNPETDLGLGWVEAAHPDDRDKAGEVFLKAHKEQTNFNHLYRLRHLDGSYRWVVDAGNVRVDSMGRYLGMVGTVVDVHEQKIAEERTKASEERLLLALEAAQIGFWYWDVGSSSVLWSEELRKDWGFPEGQFTGNLEEVFKKIHPDDALTVTNALKAALEDDVPYSLEYRMIPSPGKVTWIRAKGIVQRNEEGKPLRMTGSSLDITADRKAQEEIVKSQRSAEAANEAKSSFLTNMSHEIRTPLGNIIGFADLLLQSDLRHKDFVEYLSVIQRNSSHLLKIIDDILDLSKVEAGKMMIESIDFSLPRLLSDFAALMGFKAREKGIDFDLEIASTLPEKLISDPGRIRQILNNVVGNAIKFTESGNVKLQVTLEHGELVFEVSDTGRGISKAQAHRLFQPFEQADPSTNRKFGGTGLGLVLTRRLCQALGGDFTLMQSELNEGSRFRASVKVRSVEGSPDIQKSLLNKTLFPVLHDSSSRSDLEGMRVLLVEDSPDNQALLKILLTKFGANVDIAGDGREGVAWAMSKPHDVILMDIQMPNMDGHEATRHLRSSGYEGPIVALTAHAMLDEREKCLNSGFSAYLSKPVQREKLLQTLIGIRDQSLVMH